MSASPAMLQAFERWRDAELTAVNAAPCSDDALDDILEVGDDAIRTLAALPAVTADDVLLKLLPLALILNTPRPGLPQLHPVNEPYPPDSDYQEDALWRGIIADLGAVSPDIAASMAMHQPASASAHGATKEAVHG